jgi:hypothetical protein
MACFDRPKFGRSSDASQLGWRELSPFVGGAASPIVANTPESAPSLRWKRWSPALVGTKATATRGSAPWHNRLAHNERHQRRSRPELSRRSLHSPRGLKRSGLARSSNFWLAAARYVPSRSRTRDRTGKTPPLVAWIALHAKVALRRSIRGLPRFRSHGTSRIGLGHE